MLESTDRILALRAKHGDVDAFERLVERYQGLAFHAAFLITGDAQDAEDVIQEAFLKSFYGLPRFRSGASFKPWLMRIVTNEAQNRRRSTTRYVKLLLRAAEDAPPAGAESFPEALVVSEEQQQRVLSALSMLPDEDRILLSYRYLLDLSPSEIAAALDCPPSTARSRLARARQRLQGELEHADETRHADAARLKETPTPDLRSALRARIEAPATTATHPHDAADPLPAASNQPAFGGMRMFGDSTSRRREIATLAAGIAVFTVVATVLALVFGYSGWRDEGDSPGSIENDPASAVVADATATEPSTADAPLFPTPSDALPLTHPAMQALIIATTDASDVTQLHKVDATTLEPIAGENPLDVTEPREAIAEHTYSYDGRYLALVIRNEAGASKKVQLVDLDAWTMTEVPIPESSAAPVMIQNRLLRFVPGSNDLLWASSRSPHEFRLIRYSVASAQSATVELPDGCVPTEVYPLANDQQVAVLCSMFGPVGFATDVMHVLVVDMATGAVTSDIRLDGVDSGSLEVTGSASDNFPVHNVTPGLAFDRQRNLLYVVPVRGEQLIVVDLSAGAIRSEVSWAPNASWLERIKGWFAPTSAQAIARAISYGYASLSPDGERLYIATASEQLTEDRRTTEEINASAFVIIDTTTLEVIQRLDLGMVRSIVPAPDGEHAIVYTAPHIFIVGDYTTTEGRALYLINGATGEVEQELEQTGHPVRPMMSNGDNVYLELFQTDGREWLVVDANTMTVVGSNADPDATRLLVP